jgi:hypothetical protein
LFLESFLAGDGRPFRFDGIDAFTAQRANQMAMKFNKVRHSTEGKIGWILLWLIGVPLPILLIFFLLRGCT